jgi:GNAT superfamily N-acetyltransferase
MVELAVDPRHGGRGVGTALLHEVRAQAAAAGRTSLLTEVDCPLDAGEGWPGARFARATGMTMRLGDIRREVSLPVDQTLWRRLRAEADRHSTGYRLRSWAGPTAVGDLPAMAALLARMSTDAPLGDLEYEPETWDAGRVLDEEARYTAQGYRWWTVLAETAAGEPAGFTQLGCGHRQPQRLWQWDTLVVREHRGHRLGLAMKLVVVDAAASAQPTATSVTTWNAASNAPMIAVNEAMGFGAVEATQEWQGPV